MNCRVLYRLGLVTAGALLVLLSGLSAPVAAAVTMPVTDQMTVTADSMSTSPGGTNVEAHGSVILTWQGMRLTADKVLYERATTLLTADGHVVIVKGDETLKGESARLNLDTGLGELHNAQLTNPAKNLTVSGEKVERIGPAEYSVSGSELTSCTLPDPSWKFKADTLTVDTLGGYATGRDVVFYIKNTPVVYLPWIAFPVVTEKKSGLLFPRFGYSRSRGAQIDIPYYLVLSPSQDVQFDLDLQSRRGVGMAADYRYIRSRGSEGSAYGYLIYDFERDRWRGQFEQTHKEIFSPDANLRSSINLYSDRTFQEDFDEKTADRQRQPRDSIYSRDFIERNNTYNRQYTDSIINSLTTWQNVALTGHLRYSEDYYAANNKATLQKLPEVGLSAVHMPVFGTPLRFDLDSNLTNFTRETGTSGQRAYLFPRLSIAGGLPGMLNLSAGGGLYLRGYTTNESSGALKSSDGDMIPQLDLRASSSLVRIYDTGWDSLKKVRHELMPEVRYSFTPFRNQERLPFYDYSDRINHQSTAWLSLTSTLDGRFQQGESNVYRDLSRIRISQGYTFAGERRDLLTLVDPQRPWSDLIFESETRLTDAARLTVDARYDHQGSRFTSIMPGVVYDDRQGSFASAGYRMVRDQLEYFEAHLGTRKFTPWVLDYATRYSFDKGGFLETVYTVEYRHQCWGVSLSFHDRPGNPSFSFNFNLEGLTANRPVAMAEPKNGLTSGERLR